MLRSCLPVLAAAALAGGALAQGPSCPEIGPFQHWTGSGDAVVPGFVAGEEWGATFQVPANEYPIEILRVGFGWGSVFGGSPATVEDSVRIYTGGVSTPGGPQQIFSLGGPQLVDGAINEFDLSPIPQGPGQDRTVASGPFTVTIRLFFDSQPLGPAPSHDNNGCQLGRNVIFATPGGWQDACALGVSGDWQVHVVYRSLSCSGGGLTAYCFGDGTGAACPCDPGQSGQAGAGCANSFGTGGKLDAAGSASVSNDTVVLSASGLPPTTTGLYFQGTVQPLGGLGTSFGDGLLCVSGSVIRLGSKIQSGGQSSFGFGVGSDPLISVKGQVPGAGTTRYYQVWYRNNAPFCTSEPYNLTNGIQIDWGA